MSIEKLDLPDTNVKVSSSPERHTFQKEGYIKNCEEEGKEPNPDYVNMYKTWREQDEENLKDPAWQKDNLEYDLRSTSWILEKARASENYAQNIYAALCNMRWQRIGMWPALKDEYWSCSWRSAGGVVSDMLGTGDYIDWYCSGIGSQDTGYGLSDKKPELEADGRTYVPEGVVTEEIRKDFQTLGWVPSEWPDED
jgi:hypothetical protein